MAETNVDNEQTPCNDFDEKLVINLVPEYLFSSLQFAIDFSKSILGTCLSLNQW